MKDVHNLVQRWQAQERRRQGDTGGQEQVHEEQPSPATASNEEEKEEGGEGKEGERRKGRGGGRGEGGKDKSVLLLCSSTKRTSSMSPETETDYILGTTFGVYLSHVNSESSKPRFPRSPSNSILTLLWEGLAGSNPASPIVKVLPVSRSNPISSH
ncbi:hypothetical protein C6341_g25520 [Phytophthora cactorum]|nr:hypothetical protein C6341_g25520 [Phytophthora cactorum]